MPQMSTNFRRFNSRIGVVFVFQAKLIRLLSWRKPSHTVSLLFVHTFLCLDPYLLAVLPLALLVLGVFIPAFLTRHPAPPIQLSSSFEYSPKGPPLAPAREVKPVKELSKDFFRNMRDLQNCMEDFSVMHDAIVTNVGPVTNFSDEALSSTLFVVCFLGCATMFVGAHVVPWWLIFLLFGWFVILSGHPRIASWLNAEKKKNNIDEREERAKGWLEKWIESDILLDSEPEVQEVEIFELQKLRKETGEWEPWVFSPSPYDPLSSARISDERPKGTRFFEDVAPPKGWEWSEKKWTLDLHSREWVEERIITGVEIETEGERWVYDIHYNEEAARKFGMHDDDKKKKGKSKSKEKNVLAPAKPTWEEGVEGQGKKGLWRRRRWVRLVKRRVMETSEGS